MDYLPAELRSLRSLPFGAHSGLRSLCYHQEPWPWATWGYRHGRWHANSQMTYNPPRHDRSRSLKTLLAGFCTWLCLCYSNSVALNTFRFSLYIGCAHFLGWDQEMHLSTDLPTNQRFHLLCHFCWVLPQGHRYKALHQGHESGAQNPGHLLRGLSPFVAIVKSPLDHH